jgi:tartrate-resistant acid phosphatase type 5
MKRRVVLGSCCFALCAGLACGSDRVAEGVAEGGSEESGGQTSSNASEADGKTTEAEEGGATTQANSGPVSDGSSEDGGNATTRNPTEGGEETTGGEEQPEPEVLRFIAMGDAGEGNAGQYNVAAAIEQICADKGGCEFVLYLGDNFYNDGVSSVNDDQFQTKFEMPYADLDMPFWVVMGNHDYGELSFLWDKLEYEVEYTSYSDKWTMPDKWYTVDQYPNVDIFAMDTTRLMWNHETNAQRTWLDTEIAASNAPWKIAIGHHPYLSNGAHGNAGNYEGWSFPSQVAGTHVKNVMDASLCGKVDLYLAGHDHNRQWPEGTCGAAKKTHFIVSGAGSKTTSFKYHDGNPVYWEDDSKPGFLVLELTPEKIHGEFYDQDGNLEFQHEITK